ncbi:hypothetical protein D3C72_2528370 [compost metagenome]
MILARFSSLVAQRIFGITGNTAVLLLHHGNVEGRQLEDQLLFHRFNQPVR